MPPITESETGRVVGRPIDVEGFHVDVTEAGVAVFYISGLVPSPCHEAVFGFEEANAAGLMLGTAESWLDPTCDLAGGPTAFSVSMELTGLAPGGYIARIDGGFEARFTIPSEVAAEPVPVERTVWRPIPVGPLSARQNAHVFWTGTEVLLMGGSDAPPCPPGAGCASPNVAALRDGAAFNPETGEWQQIAPAPVPLGSASGVVSDGVVYLWVHGLEARPDSQRAFLAYHITEDRWEPLPMPATAPDWVALADGGDFLVLYQPTQELGVSRDLLFDLQAGRWTELPADPLQSSFDRTMVWTGTELVLLGIEGVPQPGSERPAFYRAAAYHIESGSWRRLPDSEVIDWNPTWYWAAGRIVNPSLGSSDGGAVNNYGRHYPFGGILNPASGEWEPLPDPPDQPTGFTGYSAGSPELLLNHEGWSLDTLAGQWDPVPTTPDNRQQGSAVTWAAFDLFVWGGVQWANNNGELLNTGWMWRPES